MKVYVSGIGLISAIGRTIDENLISLREKKTGITKIEILKTIHSDKNVAGEIKLTNEELSKDLNTPEVNSYPRTTLLAIHAAKEAYKNAGLENDSNFRTGVIIGTTVGGMDRSEIYYKNPKENSDFIRTHHCGFITEKVAEYLNAFDMISTISTACSSGLNSMLLGARLIKNNMLDRVVVGGTDSLSRFTLNGFKTLMILDPEICAPFDKNRKGLNLGEGAGFLIIESERSLEKRGKDPICELSGYGNANDAFHQTASTEDGTGPYLSMEKALKVANLKPEDIDYINVHGTGTNNNDITEGIALKRLFKNNVPLFSSTKSFTGHTLGASGGIEAVFSVLSIKHDLIFPNINFSEPIEELGLIPVTEVLEGKGIRNVMTNSFGFGGNDSTLIFSKI